MTETKDIDLFDDGSEGRVSSDSDVAMVPKKKLVLMKKMLLNIKDNNDQLMQMLAGYLDPSDEKLVSFATGSSAPEDDAGGRIIEGVFDGENMIGSDGKQYSVPANYASKSKLIEGDVLKLTIASNGNFLYKQIGPIDRKRVVGTLAQSVNGNFYVENNGRKWKVLTASVTYYRGTVGDEVIIMIPKVGESNWAAVDNIVRNEVV